MKTCGGGAWRKRRRSCSASAERIGAGKSIVIVLLSHTAVVSCSELHVSRPKVVVVDVVDVVDIVDVVEVTMCFVFLSRILAGKQAIITWSGHIDFVCCSGFAD